MGKNKVNQRSGEVGLFFTLAYQGTSYLIFFRNKICSDLTSTEKSVRDVIKENKSSQKWETSMQEPSYADGRQPARCFLTSRCCNDFKWLPATPLPVAGRD